MLTGAAIGVRMRVALACRLAIMTIRQTGAWSPALALGITQPNEVM
jgi:hypothetical protein